MLPARTAREKPATDSHGVPEEYVWREVITGGNDNRSSALHSQEVRNGFHAALVANGGEVIAVGNRDQARAWKGLCQLRGATGNAVVRADGDQHGLRNLPDARDIARRPEWPAHQRAQRPDIAAGLL